VVVVELPMLAQDTAVAVAVAVYYIINLFHLLQLIHSMPHRDWAVVQVLMVPMECLIKAAEV